MHWLIRYRPRAILSTGNRRWALHWPQQWHRHTPQNSAARKGVPSACSGRLSTAACASRPHTMAISTGHHHQRQTRWKPEYTAFWAENTVQCLVLPCGRVFGANSDLRAQIIICQWHWNRPVWALHAENRAEKEESVGPAVHSIRQFTLADEHTGNPSQAHLQPLRCVGHWQYPLHVAPHYACGYHCGGHEDQEGRWATGPVRQIFGVCHPARKDWRANQDEPSDKAYCRVSSAKRRLPHLLRQWVF